MPGSPAFIPADGFQLAAWMGIPFRPHGRDRQGADCYGLVYLFYRDVFGMGLPRLDRLVHDVEDPRETGRLMAEEAQGPRWRRVPAPVFGDVIAFGTPHLVYHVGLYLEPGLMLHTRAGTDSTPERYLTPLWQPRLQAFFRYRD